MAEIAGDRISYKIDVDGLSKLDGMQRVIKQIDKLMPKLDKSVKGANDSLNKLNADMSKENTSGLDKDKKHVDAINESLKKTGKAADTTESRTTRLGNSMDKSFGKSFFNRHTKDLGKLGSQMQSFGSKATVVTAGLTAGAAVALKTATQLQNRYKIINNLAVTGGEKSAEVQKNVNQMQRDGTKYSNEYGVATKKIADGYETLVRRGYTSNQALGAQKSYLQGAIASGDSYTDVVNNAASAIEQFGMKVNSVKGMANASKVAINQMAYSADLTATSFGDLGEALKYAGPDAHAANQTLHETVSAIGDLSNFGIDGSQAGTSMRQIYQRLINPPAKGKAPNAMDKLGLKYSDFRDAKNELMPIQDIFAKLDSRMKGMSKTDKGGIYAALFGVNASSAAQALGSSYKQVDALDKKVKESQNMNHGEGYVAQLSKKNLGSLQNQWNRIKNGLLNSSVQVANAWMPTITKLAKAAADLLEKFQALPTPAKKFIGLATVVTAAIGPLAILAGTFLKVGSSIDKVVSKLGKTTLISGLGKRVARTEASFRGSSMLSSGSYNRQVLRSGASKIGRGVKMITPKPIRNLVGKGTAKIKGIPDRIFGTKVRDINATTRLGRFGKTGIIQRASEAFPRVTKLAGKGSNVLKGAGKLARNVPILDIAAVGMNMLGTNKNNAGKKVGSTAGMLAGGLAGSLFGPIGSMAGAAIGDALGSKLGQTIDKTMPKKIRKSLGKIISSIGKVFNALLKPFQSTIKSIQKVWNSSTKGISKTWSKYVVKPLSGKNGGKFLTSVFKGFKTVMVPTMKVAGVAFKVFGAVVKTTISVVADILKGLIKTISGIVSLISDIFHGRWKNIWKDAMQIFSGIFGTIGNVFKDILTSLWNGLKDFGTNVGKFLAHPIKTIQSWFKAPKTGSTNNSKGYFTNGATVNLNSKKNKPKRTASYDSKKINIATGVGHASGGLISRTHMAMVNEAGTEIAYSPNLGRFRLLGNGPTIAKVHAGEHIINAKDTAKLLSGGLGRGKTLPGYAKGTGSIKATTVAQTAAVKVNGTGLEKTMKATKKSMKSITGYITDGYDDSNKRSKKTIDKLQDNAIDTFNELTKSTKKQTQKIQSNTVGDFDDMQKGSQKQMDQMHKGMNAVATAIVSDFGKIFGKLDNYAHRAMASAIKQLNGGISGINTVLNKFGGGGSVLPLIHYAQGSKGPISKHTMAVVNDAKTGPRQETIVAPNGKTYMPQGNDAVVPLGPGYEVLNGHETAQLQEVGALPHFAKGTGGLKRLIEKNNKNPKAAWKSNFGKNAQGKSSSFLGGTLSRMIKNASNKVGNPWNAEVWSQMKDAMSGGDSAGGPVRHSPGSGWTVSSGFGYRGQVSGGYSQHDGVDFSSAKTVHAMNTGVVKYAGGAPAHWGGADGIGENVVIGGGGLNYIYQELNGKYDSGAKLLVSKGDSVKAGQAIAVLGPSGTHVHVGATKHPMFSIPGSSTAGWLNPLHVTSKEVKGNDKKSKSSKNPALTKLVKSQIGSQLKWVSKNLAERDEIGSLGSLGLSGSISSRARILAAALKKLYPSATKSGIAAILGNWSFESHLDPTQVNPGGGATGLGQWLAGRATALKNFAKSKGKSWKNPSVQLEYALSHDSTDSGIFKRILSSHGSVSSLAAAFSNQWERGGYTQQHVNGATSIAKALHANGGWAKKGKVNVFGEVKGQNEVAINTSRPTADKLIMEAISDRASKDPNGLFGKVKAFAKMQNEFKKMKLSRIKFNSSVKADKVEAKPATIRPSFNYHPEIHIEGASDPEQTGKVVAQRLTEDRREFTSMMNDYLNATMAQF